MKKLIIKPGFEFIFTLSILAVLGLPPLVFAQNSKDMQININNGDTTINGRNIKDLSARDRQKALKDINNISTINNTDGKHDVVIKRIHKGDGLTAEDDDVNIDGPVGNNAPMAANGRENGTMKYRHRSGKDSTLTFSYNYRINGVPDDRRKMGTQDWRSGRMENNPMEFDHKNTQIFNYITTDNNGVSTHVSYRVSEPTGALSHMGGTAENTQFEKLDMMDLNIVPEFSAGKTVIMFTLPSKALAEVQLKDSKGNLVWSDRAVNGSFTKSFALGLNGVYYLRVEQKGKLAVKKIFKE